MQGLFRTIKKSPKIKKSLLFITGMAKKFYMLLINKTFGVNGKKVIFTSFGGKSYSDNPRAISEKLHSIDPEFEIIWLFNNPEEKRKVVPYYVKCVKSNSLSAYKELATAKFWVDNFGKPLWTFKSRKQIYIQTWHGDRGFKKILYDTRTLLPNGHYKEGDLFETKKADAMTVGSDFGVNKIKGAFGFNGLLLKNGSPRNDLLIKDDEATRESIKKSLGIQKDDKIVLFAPTFRKSSCKTKQSFHGLDLVEIIKKLEQHTGYTWICLVRAHSASRGLSLRNESTAKIIEVTDYEDMADLLLISDLFITDYSSSAGDFILRKKPLILFQPDREEYISNDRSLYFDINNSPFIVTMNQKELMRKILDITLDKAKKNCEDIMEFYGTFETGNASEKVVEYMLSKF